MKKWPKCKCGQESTRVEYVDHGSGLYPFRIECEKCYTRRIDIEKTQHIKAARKAATMKGGGYSLRDIIAPVRGMGRTAKLQNFWLSVFARYDIRTPQDLVDRADRLWKMRNVGTGTIAGIVMSAGRFGLIVPPNPNCKWEDAA